MEAKKSEEWKTASIDVVKRYIDAFDLNYQKSEKEIFDAFKSVEGDYIRKRVHLINAYYHTRVPLDGMTEVIQSETRLDDLIKAGDARAVEKIAECDGKNYFSFATKYCCFSEPEKYPIYDSLSIRTLQWFIDERHFCGDKINFESLRINKDYDGYRSIVNQFRKVYKLNGLCYKNLDKFLWLVGKNM